MPNGYRDDVSVMLSNHLQNMILEKLTNMPLAINSDRLLRELHQLASITDCPPTADTSLPEPTQAVTRIVFTPRDLEARAWLTA